MRHLLLKACNKWPRFVYFMASDAFGKFFAAPAILVIMSIPFVYLFINQFHLSSILQAVFIWGSLEVVLLVALFRIADFHNDMVGATYSKRQASYYLNTNLVFTTSMYVEQALKFLNQMEVDKKRERKLKKIKKNQAVMNF